MKASIDQLVAAYAETRSIGKVAQRFGMCPQSVHERLARVGTDFSRQPLTEAQLQLIRDRYEEFAASGNLDRLAEILERTKHFLCRKAGEMGLTDQKRAKPYALGRKTPGLWNGREHPRGMAGKRHSPGSRATMSASQQRRWDTMTPDQREAWDIARLGGQKRRTGLNANRESATWQAGWREIGGQRKYFRSKWEANYARFLEWRRGRGEILGWEHEPKTFWFEGIRRGVCSYKPDFRVTFHDTSHEWHEVKGWMDDRSRVALSRFAKFYPHERLILIDRKVYAGISRSAGVLIGGWE